jgi:hypothetical protein
MFLIKKLEVKLRKMALALVLIKLNSLFGMSTVVTPKEIMVGMFLMLYYDGKIRLLIDQ